MYNVTPTNLHIELTNQCNAKCPMCARTDPNGLGSLVEVPHEITIRDIEHAFSDNVFKQVNYCGNYGDPLMCKDVLKIVDFFKPAVQLIHTNGSIRSTQFWKSLARIPNVRVIFGIDGTTQSVHEYYRRNTNLSKILANAKTFNDNGGESWWQFILFEHNKHQLDEAQQLAKQLGFKKFEVLYTRRFYESPIFHYSIGENKFTLQPVKQPVYKPAGCIECKAQQLSEVYVSSVGDYYPCTYVAGTNYKSAFNIRTHKLQDVNFPEIVKQPLDACFVNCQQMIRNKRERNEL